MERATEQGLVHRKRQKSQMELAFFGESRGEAPMAPGTGSELRMAERPPASSTDTEHLMEEVLDRENLQKALKRVQGNKGSAGVDGMNVEELPDHLRNHWQDIRVHLLTGTYKPRPVRREKIPKSDGGERELGIPTVLDRFIQQAVLQVLQRRWDPTFSEHSYGFRPGRRAHQAVAKAQEYITEGHEWVVDIDLEKFFDRVNHDRLMARVAERVKDKRLLLLIRAYLNAGIMDGGLVSPRTEGVPQGGPLSPLLSNLVLDELDRELERREHRFVRYADDCNIYVRSERAGQRVMENVTRFIHRKLKLKVNASKSAVARPSDRKFLGFSFTNSKEPKRRISNQAKKKFKEQVRRITRRSRGVSIECMADELARYLKGWIGYYGYCQTPSVLRDFDSWLRRRLRSKIWKSWKRGRTRYAELMKRGVQSDLAAQTAGSSCNYWHISRSPGLSIALPNLYFSRLGLPSLKDAMFE
jgi:RNA-directed DNA polymerase